MPGRDYLNVLTLDDVSVYPVVADPNTTLTASRGSVAISNEAGHTKLWVNTDGATAWSPLLPTVTTRITDSYDSNAGLTDNFPFDTIPAGALILGYDIISSNLVIPGAQDLTVAIVGDVGQFPNTVQAGALVYTGLGGSLWAGAVGLGSDTSLLHTTALGDVLAAARAEPAPLVSLVEGAPRVTLVGSAVGITMTFDAYITYVDLGLI